MDIEPSHGQWYMITYTLTKEIVDNETIFKFRGYYNGKLLRLERTYNNWVDQYHL